MIPYVKPWMLKLGLSLLVLSLAFYSGARVANWHRDSLELERAQTVEAAASAFDERLIARQELLRPIHKIIQTEAREVIREVPIYISCVNEPSVERLLDDARANRSPGTSEAGVP